MKILFNFLFFFFCIELSSQATWANKTPVGVKIFDWTQKANFTGASRVATTGFAVKNYGYVFGGTNVSSEYNDLYRYDPQANSWLQRASMPIAGMREPASFVIDTVAYVGLGFRAGETSHLSSMYRYNPGSNQWTAVANFPQGRRASAGFAIDSLGYIFGGFEYGSQPDNSLYSYSPVTNKWTKKASMPGTGRSYPVCAVVGGKAYAMGGMYANGSTYVKDFYCYDPTGNSWTSLTDFPGSARKGACCFVIGDVIYIGNGKDNSNHFTDWWGYDTKKSSWFAVKNFTGSYQYGNASFSINGKGYVSTGAFNSTVTNTTYEFALQPSALVAAVGFAALGYGYVFGGTNLTSDFSTLYQYNVQTNTWAKKSDMPVAGMREPAAFVVDSFAYIGLGFRAGTTSHLSTMYKYDLKNDAWTSIASFAEGRRAATGFAIDSLGYIFGGFNYGGSPDNSLYAYSPKSNKWTKKASMPGSGRSYPACGVVNGKAYIMGGMYSNGTTYANDFYKYDPVANSWTQLTAFPGTARKGASVCVLGDIVFIGNGKENTAYFRDWWGYNTQTNQWFSVSSFPSHSTYGNAYFALNGKGYLATGAFNNTLMDSTFELSYQVSSVQQPESLKSLFVKHISYTSELEISSVEAGYADILVYDESGRLVDKARVQLVVGENNLQLNDMPAGLYLVEVIQAQNRAALKIAR